MKAVTKAMVISAVLASACGPREGPPDADGTWVGTITTEGNVTTVVNEAGSVWGGEVGLEETLSIEAEVGDGPYLLHENRCTTAFLTHGIFTHSVKIPI